MITLINVVTNTLKTITFTAVTNLLNFHFMKKLFFVAVLAFGAMVIASCNNSDCCKLLTVKYGEGDEPSGMTWDDYKAQLDAAGYNCD